MDAYFMTGEEVAELLRVSQSSALKLIRDLNAELEKKGFYTFRGRVPRKYLYERIGLEEKGGE